MNHIELGKEGEKMAIEHLIRHGFKVIDRNVRIGRGELDVVCIHEKELIFVEVKARVNTYCGEPEQAVNGKKQVQLIKLANEYMGLKHLDYEIRFDIISIVLNGRYTHLKHIKNAFYPIA